MVKALEDGDEGFRDDQPGILREGLKPAFAETHFPVDPRDQDIFRSNAVDSKDLADLREDIFVILVQIINGLSGKTLGWKHQRVGMLM